MKIYGPTTLQDKISLLDRRTHKSIYKEGVESIVPRAIVLTETTRNDTGEAVTVATIIDQSGTCWDTVSAVVTDMLAGVIDICESENGAYIKSLEFSREMSRKGREFLVCKPVLEVRK